MDDKPHSKKKEPPALKKYMHPRNPYKTPPSFKKLAISYPEFRKFCTYDIQGRVHLDFKSPQALRALTQTLLEKDFGLKVQIPDNRLVPTLPLRFNYLLWIQDLLSLGSPNSIPGQKNSVVGFDIGTGASCIYPILSNKQFGWSFIASESDNSSFEYACKNVACNQMNDHILLKKDCLFFEILDNSDTLEFIKKCRDNPLIVSHGESSSLIKALGNKDLKMREGDLESFLVDFTMCNPPFFSSEEDLDTLKKSRKDDRSEPPSAPTGALQEKVVEGGEVAFIEKMIIDSVAYKDKIRLFTSLIGQKKDVQTIKGLIQQIDPSHFKITEFCQGRTMRWGIAWTFDSTFSINKNVSKKEKMCNKPLCLVLPRTSFSVCSASGAWKKIAIWLKELKIRPTLIKCSKYYVGAQFKAYKKTWLNQRRKRREEARKKEQSDTQVHPNASKRKPADAIESPSSAPKIPKLDTGSLTCINETSANKSVTGCHDDQVGNYSHSLNSASATLQENSATNTVESSELNGHINDMHSSTNGNLEHNSNCTSGEQDHTVNSNASGLECLLRCSIGIKFTNGLITLEMSSLGGKSGKESLNEIMQYFKNKLRSNN